jgi:hypothetical protein
MASLIQIPADVTIVTVSTNGSNQPQRWTPDYARSVLNNASGLLKDRAQIQFYLNSCAAATEEMPAGTRSDVVDESGYHFLVARHKAGAGVRVLLVDRVSQRDVGGEARAQTRACLVAFGADLSSTGRMLAHELGHLLDLDHVDRIDGPGHEKQNAAAARNLMNAGALNPLAELTPDQVSQARGSALASRFGGP